MSAGNSQQQEALARLASLATANESLAQYTTYRVGGAAAVFASPRNEDDLNLVAEVVRDTGLATLVVGRGSNLLIADAGFAGIAISLAHMAEWVRFEDVVVHAGAAMALPVLARRSVAVGHRSLCPRAKVRTNARDQSRRRRAGRGEARLANRQPDR